MPTFSEITIEFIQDFEVDYTLNMVVNTNGVISNKLFTWVVTRGATGEVTTGTPTGTAGETTATNFEAAYDLDNPTNYITTRTVNSLVIQSETEGEDFLSVRVLDENGNSTGDAIGVTFDNFIPPIDTSNIEFALVKSPHYVNIPFDFETTTSVTLDLFVWDGDLSVVPAVATYSLTLPRPSINFAEFNVDLAKLIAEQLEPKPFIDLGGTPEVVDSTADSVKWVNYVASYTDPDEEIADIQGTFVSVDGYGFYDEGVNPTKPTNNILSTCFNRKVSRDGIILFPFVNNGTITSIDIESSTGEISDTETMVTSNESTDIVQYIQVDLTQTSTDNSLTITTQPAGDVSTYEIIDECRYEPIQVLFKNKYGAYEGMTLFKKSNVNISTQNDEFVNNYINAGTYDTTKHQYQKLNVTAKKTIKVNSGYVKESENDLYEQVMYSDSVYFYENNNLIPVKVTNSGLEFKTRVNDKLINYTIDFEYAYNIIQNV